MVMDMDAPRVLSIVMLTDRRMVYFFIEPVWPSRAVPSQWNSGCLAVEKKSVAKWQEQKKSFVKWRELLLSRLRPFALPPPHPYNTGFNGYVRTVDGQGGRTTRHEPRHSVAAGS